MSWKTAMWISLPPLGLAILTYLFAAAFAPGMSPEARAAGAAFATYGAVLCAIPLLLVFLPAIVLGMASAIFGWGPVFLGLWLSGGRRRR